MKSITRFTGNLHGKKCLNCDKEISEEDNFCSNCGQVNDLNRLSVKQYFSEYLNGFYEFDNRFVRTVIPLLFKPGQVSKNYVEGRRIHYVNPFQLYLHITILFFLIVGIFKTIDSFKPGAEKPASIIAEINKEKDEVNLDSIKTEAIRNLNDPESGVDSATVVAFSEGFDEVMDNIGASKDSTNKRNELSEEELKKQAEVIAFVDSLLQDSARLAPLLDESSKYREKDSSMTAIMELLDNKVSGMTTKADNIMVDWTEQDGAKWEEFGNKISLKKVGANRIQEVLDERGADYTIPKRLINPDEFDLSNKSLGKTVRKVKLFMDYDEKYPDASVSEALDELGYEETYWNIFYYHKARDWNEAKDDPDFLNEWIDRVLSRVSVALFFLLPIFTIIVSLLYIRRRYNYTENLVFVFHVQTVFFILLLIFIILGRIVNSTAIPWIFLILFLIYLYKAMRKFYEQGKFKTFVKYCILNFSFMILASFGAVIVSFLAFLI